MHDDEFDWSAKEPSGSRLGAIVIVAIALAIGAAFVAFFFSQTANADEQSSPIGKCAPFADISRALKDVAHEDQVAGGLINDQNALVIFATPKGETWTAVLVTVGDDKACILNMGVGWFPVRTPKGDPV